MLEIIHRQRNSGDDALWLEKSFRFGTAPKALWADTLGKDRANACPENRRSEGKTGREG